MHINEICDKMVANLSLETKQAMYKDLSPQDDYAELKYTMLSDQSSIEDAYDNFCYGVFEIALRELVTEIQLTHNQINDLYG